MIKHKVHLIIDENKVVFANNKYTIEISAYSYLSEGASATVLSIGEEASQKQSFRFDIILKEPNSSDLNYRLIKTFFFYGFQKLAKRLWLKVVRPDVYIQSNEFLKTMSDEQKYYLFDAIKESGARNVQIEEKMLIRK